MHSDLARALQQAQLWFLATCSDGTPNVVPVGFKWVDGDRLLIADLFLRKSRENMLVNPNVAVAVATPAPKRGFQLKGVARVHERGPTFERVQQLLAGSGVTLGLNAAIAVEVTEAYRLDPGSEAGMAVSLE